MKKIIYAFIALFVLLQFFQIDKTNPETEENNDFIKMYNPPTEIANHIQAACYDCHSNKTSYPWYSNLQPVGWFLKNHIDEGRRELNFSEFGSYSAKKQAHKLEECEELIGDNEMPLKSYTITHKEAVLTDVQKKMVMDYFKKIEKSIVQ